MQDNDLLVLLSTAFGNPDWVRTLHLKYPSKRKHSPSTPIDPSPTDEVEHVPDLRPSLWKIFKACVDKGDSTEQEAAQQIPNDSAEIALAWMQLLAHHQKKVGRTHSCESRNWRELPGIPAQCTVHRGPTRLPEASRRMFEECCRVSPATRFCPRTAALQPRPRPRHACSQHLCCKILRHARA